MSDFVYPKNPNVKKLVLENANSYRPRRYLPLDKLKGETGKCKWCMKEMENRRKKYCSDACKHSAWAFFYPQRYARKYLSKRQDGKCAGCGYRFEDRTKKWFISRDRLNPYCEEWKEEFDDMGEVDHIIPIHQGGEILGIENVQLLCKPCHRKKSADERRKN